MRLILVAAAAAVLLAPAAFGAGDSGIGKGMTSTTQNPAPTQPSTNPCNPGDTYDAVKNLCTGGDGHTYKPKSN